MEIVRLTYTHSIKHFHAIAKIHISAIHHGVLPLLGSDCLAQLYRELSRIESAGVWVAIHEEQVVGFLAGCVDLQACFRTLLIRSGFRLLLHAAPSLFSWNVIRKLPALIRYPFSQPKISSPYHAPASQAELLAIAVAQDLRRGRIGRRLVAAFEWSVLDWGHKSYRVSTNAADPSSNGFYRRVGCEAVGVLPHHDLVLRQYQKQISHVRDVNLSIENAVG